jgi:hypothetical protein
VAVKNEEGEELLFDSLFPEPQIKSEGEGNSDDSTEFAPLDGDPGEGQPEDIDPEEEKISYQELQTCDWDAAYRRCPKWQCFYGMTQDPQCDWPKGFQVREDRMYLDGKECIPLSYQGPWIREHHDFLGHVGPDRLWYNIEDRVQWADKDKAKKAVFDMMKQCDTCQACQRPVTLLGPLEPTMVPKHIMQSVAIDMFAMPKTEVDGVAYNCMEVCVDRHSGWIVAVPCEMEGLIASEVAKSMLKHQWRPFGIPSVITSDQGSLFVNAWWQTMRARLGIKHAQAQAYNHRANGRAEMAGQQLMEILRKIHISENINWVEALPIALDRTHDVRGVSGLSPYEILFGRERPLANVPYIPERECEDAADFFDRMRERDEKVAQTINERHKKEMEKTSKARRVQQPLAPGDKVWYRRPENTGGKMDTRWIGPAKMVAREGEESYEIELLDGVFKKTPRRFLKPYVEDKWNGSPKPLFYHRRTVPEPRVRPGDQEVDKILGHRTLNNGCEEFLTQWVGETEREASWETINTFVPQYNSEWVAYLKRKGLHPEIYQALHSEPFSTGP